jgi:hypothetical protein
MNISLSTKTPSLRNRTIKTLLLGAMALGVSSFAAAHETVQQPASIAYRTALQPKVAPTQAYVDATARTDWNVDYPSQLAPQAVPATSNAPANVASTVDTAADQQL